jgi:hypothetical protein
MASKRRGKTIEVLVKEAVLEQFQKEALNLQKLLQVSAHAQISGQDVSEMEDTYQLHCYGLNSIDPDHPLSKEEFKELLSEPGEYLGKRWKRLCEEGKSEQVIEELEMQSSMTGFEKLAQMLALCITSAGPSQTSLPFPEGFRVEQNPLKAAHHLAANYKTAQVMYAHKENPDNIHSEMIRLLFHVLEEVPKQQRNTETYKVCRKLMRDLSEGVMCEELMRCRRCFLFASMCSAVTTISFSISPWVSCHCMPCRCYLSNIVPLLPVGEYALQVQEVNLFICFALNSSLHDPTHAISSGEPWKVEVGYKSLHGVNS